MKEVEHGHLQIYYFCFLNKTTHFDFISFATINCDQEGQFSGTSYYDHGMHMGVSQKKKEVPQNGWFIMEIPIKMDDLGGKPTINIHIIAYPQAANSEQPLQGSNIPFHHLLHANQALLENHPVCQLGAVTDNFEAIHKWPKKKYLFTYPVGFLYDVLPD